MSKRPSDEVFRALADPTRRRILELLAGRELPVTVLVGQFRITQSAVSQHLGVLRAAGLVRVRRAGRKHLHGLGTAALSPVARWAARLAQSRPA